MIAITLLISAQAFGWWGEGHEVTAYIAMQRLTPYAKKQVEQILKTPVNTPGSAKLSKLTENPMLAASWADIVKVSPLFKESYSKDPYGAESHFLSLELTKVESRALLTQPDLLKLLKSKVLDAKKNPDQKTNLLSALDDCMSQLTLPKKKIRNSQKISDAQSKALALRYLLHLIGDLHQPFHNFSIDHDMGGNRAKMDPKEIRFFSSGKEAPPVQVGNVHLYWDAMLGETKQFPDSKFFREDELTARAFSDHLAECPKIAKSYLEAQQTLNFKETEIDFAQWSAEGVLAGLEVTNEKGDKKAILGKQLVLGGYRLALVLNHLFKEH